MCRKRKELKTSHRKKKKKTESLIARNRDVRKALFSQEQSLYFCAKVLVFLTNNSNTSLPKVFLSLLQEFKDIFTKDIPSGFRPLRGIEHQIDFLTTFQICKFIELTLPRQKKLKI